MKLDCVPGRCMKVSSPCRYRYPLWLYGKIEVFYSRFGELRPQKIKENI